MSVSKQSIEKINHQFLEEDFFIPIWKVKHLFLGTFNPIGGKKVKYFYGRTTNYTWNVLSQIFNKQFIVEDLDFIKLLKENGIACMDMIRSVDILKIDSSKVTGKGYKDSNIINNKVTREYNTDYINHVIERNPGLNIYSTWGKGSKLKNWQAEVNKIENIINLVSPSKAARVRKGSVKYDCIFNDWVKKISI